MASRCSPAGCWAPAGRHLNLRRVNGEPRVWLDYEPLDALHRPSVDVLMKTAARVYGSAVLGIILTGMGSDGVEGMRAIRAAGGRTLAQSEDSCVIYGMPKAALEAGVVQRAVTLERVPDEILAAV
jgi:two-component system chemotaxis response regulator CheB